MNLKEKWGTRVWENVSTADLVERTLSECDANGQIERLEQRLEKLSSMFVNLLNKSDFNNEKILEIVEMYSWELSK